LKSYPFARELLIIAKEVNMATTSSVFIVIDIPMNSLEVAFPGEENIITFCNNTQDISRLVDLPLEKKASLVVEKETDVMNKLHLGLDSGCYSGLHRF
jgi:hypothetical protein